MAILNEIIIWLLIGGLFFLTARPLWRVLNKPKASKCPHADEKGCTQCPLQADISQYVVESEDSSDSAKH